MVKGICGGQRCYCLTSTFPPGPGAPELLLRHLITAAGWIVQRNLSPQSCHINWPFHVSRLLPLRFPAHSQLLIAPGPLGIVAVTWLFSQPSLVTRNCLFSTTAINPNLAVQYLILTFKHPCFILFPGLHLFAIPFHIPSGNPITILKYNGHYHLEFFAVS